VYDSLRNLCTITANKSEEVCIKSTLFILCILAYERAPDTHFCILYANIMQTTTKVCIKSQCLRRADHDFDKSAALWVAPGHVARHVGAESLLLLPGERALLTIIPIQTQIRFWRVAAQVLPLPRKVCWSQWSLEPRANTTQTDIDLVNMQTICRLLAKKLHTVCRLFYRIFAYFVQTL
jgi:hypothetical protein